jgi:hypothetical protein
LFAGNCFLLPNVIEGERKDDEKMENILVYAPLSSLIGVLLTLSVTTYLNWRNKRNSNRAYIISEDTNALHKLKNIKVPLGTRVICPENYEHFIEKLHEKNIDISIYKFNYSRIKNIGPGIMFNVIIQIDTSYQNLKAKIKFNLPLIDAEEEIYIVTDDKKYLEFDEYYIDSIQVDYTTLSGEQMRFVQLQKSHDTSRFIIETFYKKGFFTRRYKKLNESQSGQLNWYIAQSD